MITPAHRDGYSLLCQWIAVLGTEAWQDLSAASIQHFHLQQALARGQPVSVDHQPCPIQIFCFKGNGGQAALPLSGPQLHLCEAVQPYPGPTRRCMTFATGKVKFIPTVIDPDVLSFND